MPGVLELGFGARLVYGMDRPRSYIHDIHVVQHLGSCEKLWKRHGRAVVAFLNPRYLWVQKSKSRIVDGSVLVGSCACLFCFATLLLGPGLEFLQTLPSVITVIVILGDLSHLAIASHWQDLDQH